MLDILLGVVGTVFGWVGALFPASPFADYVQVTEDMQLGLAWLNWIFPIGEMLVLLMAWIAAMAVVTAVKVALEVTGGLGGKVM